MMNKHPKTRNYLWPVLFGIALAGFTLYLVLDTFVIRSTYQTDATQMNTALFDKYPSASSLKETTETDGENNRTERRRRSSRYNYDYDGYDSAETENTGNEITERVDLSEPLTYEDDNIHITISEYVRNDTHIYVADVQTTSAEYLKTAFAEDTYGKNITATTSEIAAAHDAILAINGDYYGARETGYVIRNGIVYRDDGGGEDVLCIYADGTMDILDSDRYTTKELIEDDVWQVLCFGPGLIENGEITVTEDDEVDRAKTSNPRTAIGQIGTNHYLFVVADGRTDASDGLTLLELAEFMRELGATTAYNLDGGGSSTMVFNGMVVNIPTSGRSINERSVSDIVYIG